MYVYFFWQKFLIFCIYYRHKYQRLVFENLYIPNLRIRLYLEKERFIGLIIKRIYNLFFFNSKKNLASYFSPLFSCFPLFLFLFLSLAHAHLYKQ